MNAENFDKTTEQISRLLSANCLDSAEVLCTLYLSALNKVEARSSVKLCPSVLELLGDVIFRKNEFRRALAYYRQSSQQRKIGDGIKDRSRSNCIENAADGQLRYKECLCHIELKDHTLAIRELESIPPNLRDLKINICMGRLYKSANLKRHAVLCFTMALREAPSAVEALEALVSLGIESLELLTILDESCQNIAEAALYADGWLITLAASLIHKRSCDHEKCDAKLQGLLTSYPKNLYILGHLGMNAMNAEKPEQAIGYFKQIRRIDSHFIDFLDQYGLLLSRTSDETELNKLAHEVLALSGDRPIGWLLVALYCELKRDTEKAIQFVDKVRIFPSQCFLRGLKLAD